MKAIVIGGGIGGVTTAMSLVDNTGSTVSTSSNQQSKLSDGQAGD